MVDCTTQHCSAAASVCVSNVASTLIRLKSPRVTCSLFLNARSSSSSPSLRLPLGVIPLLLRALLVELAFPGVVLTLLVLPPLLLLLLLMLLLLLLPPMPLARASSAAFAAARGLGVPRRVDSGAECRLTPPFKPVPEPPAPSAAAPDCEDCCCCCALLLLLVEGREARLEALRAGEAPELALPHKAAPMAPNQLPLALGLTLSALAPPF